MTYQQLLAQRRKKCSGRCARCQHYALGLLGNAGDSACRILCDMCGGVFNEEGGFLAQETSELLATAPNGHYKEVTT